jgi:hypothetical protein
MSRRRLSMLFGPSPVIFELLEARRLLSYTLDANGFTQFDPAGKRIVYVSSSTGNDGNSGFDPSAPIASVGMAKSMINNGQADWMLLKRGDTFGAIGTLLRSGNSPDDPIVIGAYGTAAPGQDPRPIVDSGTGTGIQTFGSGGAVNNFAIMGIHFIASQYNGVNGGFETCGIRLLKQGSGILIEDCMVQGFKDNITIQGDGTGVDGLTLRRSVIVDSFVASGSVGNGHSQGMYISPTSNHITIEENVFDHNGWKEGVAAATVFNHDMYIQSGAQNITVTGNIISRASENGVLLRGGGTVTNNLIIRDSVGVIVSETTSVVSGNVILEGVDLPNLAQGIGVNSVNLPGLLVENNIIAHDTSNFTSNVAAVALQWGIQSGSLDNNIVFDWRHGVSSGGANVLIDSNQIQELDGHHPLLDLRDNGGYSYSNNIYSSPSAAPFTIVGQSMDFPTFQSAYEPDAQNVALNYLDPWRDVGEYGQQFAGLDGTFDAWINAARSQTAQNWNPALMAQPAEDWIREGFTVLGQGDPNGSSGRVIVNVIATDPIAREVDDPSNPNLGTFTFTRTGPLDNPLTVTYQLPRPPGTADPIDDYPALKLSVTFPAGVSSVSQNLVPIWDHIPEGTEYAVLQLNPGAGYELGTRRSATIVIQDADTDSGAGDGGTGGTGGGTGDGGGETGGGGTSGGAPGQPPISGDGLIGDYFDDINLQNHDFTRTDYNIDMNFGSASPGNTVPATNWSARWTGEIEPEFGVTHPEHYRFFLPINDTGGARLWVNNQLVIDEWGMNSIAGDANHNGKVEITDFNILATNFGKTGMTYDQGDFDGNGKVNLLDFNILATNFGKTVAPRTDYGDIDLSADQKVPIKVEYNNTTGPSNVQLQWEVTGGDLALETVPHERLYTGNLASPVDGAQTASLSSLSSTSSTSTSTSTTSTSTPGQTSFRIGAMPSITNPFSSSTVPIDDRGALALAELV